ncbi:hypothetical protein BRD14_02855 [Halobacteriales archaeon SW_5_68_122]|nr:MAG: hypothetical protein BRD14_02855 [Halobacteriales archaeon SW_5_68_122]
MSDDIGLDEKRVYADREEATTAFVAAGAGVARVEVSADIVGEFALQRRCTARDVAASAGRLAVATAEDVLVGTVDGFEPTEFGPATSVGYHEGLVAAGGERLARYHDDGWETLAELADVRAIDGDLVAAADGVHRLDGTPLGLEAVNDVSTAGRPLAATDAGLYYLANGWMTAVEGSFRAVARDADGETAHAAGERLYERESERSEASDEPSGRREARAKRAPRTGERRAERAASTDHREGRHASREDEWRPVEVPVEKPVAGIAYGEATYAVTADGTFLADAGDGWRHRSLGLPDVAGVAVP